MSQQMQFAYLFAQPPVDHQVLRQVHGSDHPSPVVDPPHRVRLTHGRVNDRHTRPAILPCLEVLFVRLPSDVCVLLQERTAHGHSREERHNMAVEIAPHCGQRRKPLINP